MDASAIGDLLRDLSFGYALLGDKRRPWAFRNGADVVKKLGADLPAALASGDLAAMRGVGKSIVTVVSAGLEGREIAAWDKLLQDVPATLLRARKVRGLGPGKTRVLWRQLGLTSLAEIEYACHENRLVDLKGFGPSSQARILGALEAMRDRSTRMRLDRAWKLANAAIANLEKNGGVEAVHVVGELARACETVTEVELAILCNSATILPKEDVCYHTCNNPAAFGPFLLRHRGAADHVDQVRDHAASEGFELRDDGLFRDGSLLDLPTDDAVYSELGLHTPAHERREGDVPLRADDEAPEDLVARDDLKGALHNHTRESDGLHTLEQMRDAAAERGLSYLGISDHSITAMYAGGLSAMRLATQKSKIDALNADGSPCLLLSGVESDILSDGKLDYLDEVLDTLDVVVASVHNRQQQGHDKMTARMVTAANHRHGDILGHPTGRLLLGREASPMDMPAVLDACAASATAVELNANPQRLDLCREHLQMAKQRGLKVSIAADAHAMAGLDNLDHGVRAARRAGLSRTDVLNCLDVDELRAWVARRRNV